MDKIYKKSKVVNFIFLKHNLKENIWVMLAFLVLFIAMTCLAIGVSDGFMVDENTNGTQSFWDAVQYFNVWGWLGESLISAFAIVLSLKFINIEINKGYLSSWLTLPMSRTTVLLTKFLNFFIYSLTIVLVNFIVQIAFCAAKYSDFNANNVLSLIELNIGLLLMFMFIFSIVVFFSLLISNPFVMVMVVAIILIIFITFVTIPSFTSSSKLAWMKYCTPFSLYNLFNSNNDPDASERFFVNNKDANIIWKYLLIILFSSGFLVGSWALFKQKDFNLG